MKVWQGTWHRSGQFYLWAEYPEVVTPLENTSADFCPRHPYAPAASELTAELTKLEFDVGNEVDISLLLPSSAEMPHRSPLIDATFDPSNSKEMTFKSWSVPAVSLPPLYAINLLTSLTDRTPEGVYLDSSLKYWLEAAKLLLDLVAHGRFVPTLQREGMNHAARWQIILREAEDKQRFDTLATAMPGICCSTVEISATQLPEPDLVLSSFINMTGDALIRSFLLRTPFEVEVDSTKRRQIIPARWLKSLTSTSATVEGPTFELSEFEQKLRNWSAKVISKTERHALQTLFKLVAPESPAAETEADWALEFCLTSPSDHSLILPASEMWQGELGFLSDSEFSAEALEETLLRDLGRACSVYPTIKRALNEPFPTQLKLTIAEAYHFLRESSQFLEKADFAVELPSWWHKPDFQLGLHLKISSDSDQPNVSSAGGQSPSSHLGINQLLDFSWEIALGSELISIDEFKQLINKSVPLVAIRDQWVELPPDKAQATLAFIEKQSTNNKIRALDALRLGLGLESEDVVLPVVGFSADGWIQRLLDSQQQSIPLAEQPENFGGQLRPYQLAGLGWLKFLTQAGVGGCLADDMGLGKTIQLLALLLDERASFIDGTSKVRVPPTLLVVPTSIIENWEREAKTFTPGLRSLVFHGPQRPSSAEFKRLAQSVDLVITTYNLAYREENALNSIEWGRIALDEAQNIKNLGTKQTQAIKRIVQDQLLRSTDGRYCHRLVLTGTPLENRLEELWSIYDFLNPGYLGPASEFRSKYALPIEHYRDKDAAQKLSKIVKPFILRRLKSDPSVISDLPDKIEINEYISLTEEQAALYQQVLDSMLPQVGQASGIHRKGLVLATITKLKQICNHPTLFLKNQSSLHARSGKVARLLQLLEVIIAEGDSVLIFTQYAQMGHLLKDYLQEQCKQEVLFLHGSQPKATRTKLVDRFQTGTDAKIFILSLKAGGFGLNLTAANQVVHFDQWWNPAVEEQATDRAYRIGQKRNVQVRKFICKGTLEEKVAAMLDQKRDLADRIVGSTRNTLTQLSTEELAEVLKLTAPYAESTDND